MTRAPDGRHIAWHTSQTNQLFVSPYPPGARQQLVAAGGVEPIWLSPTDLLLRSSVTWFKARFDAVSGALIGAPTLWGRDPRFVVTPGWSNRSTWTAAFCIRSAPSRVTPAMSASFPASSPA